MTGLPTGWSYEALADVAEWGSGGTPQARNPKYYGGSIPWAVIGDLNDGVVTQTRMTITKAGLDSSSAKMVPEGAVLVAMYGSIGKLGIAGRELSTNQAIAFAVPGPKVLPRFLFYYLLSQRQTLDSAGKGAAQRNISQTILKAWPIRFPRDLMEQRRIVDILEDHLSRLDSGGAELGRVDRWVNTFRSAAITTALAAAGGEERTLGSLATSIRNGIFVSRAKPIPNGVPILRIGAVRSLSLDLTDLRYSERAVDDLAEDDALLAADDLLFTRYNGNPRFVGACAVVPFGVGELTYPDKLIRVRVDRELADPSFVALSLSFGNGRQQIQTKVKTTSGQAGISGADLKRVTVPLPSLPLQMEAVKRAREQLDEADRLTVAIDLARQRGATLRRTLLDAAFSGRLTGRPTDRQIVEEMTGV